MIEVLLDGGMDSSALDDIHTGLDEVASRGLEVQATVILGDKDRPVGSIDAVVTTADRVASISAASIGPATTPRLIALMVSPDVSDSRFGLANAVSVLQTAGLSPIAQGLAVVGIAVSAGVMVPSVHASTIASRLDDPPRPLTMEEEHILGLAAAHSIESIGFQLGLSRRPAQRRFRKLCDELGLQNHRQACVASARWGLTNTDLQRRNG